MIIIMEPMFADLPACLCAYLSRFSDLGESASYSWYVLREEIFFRYYWE